ncbi:MAG: hypothetical protein ACFBSE_08860 [Prochloraceae cyanobacterium]
MKAKIKIAILEKAANKIEAIAARVSKTSDRNTINLEVNEVIADLETAILEMKNIYKQKQLSKKEDREIERLKPASSQI